jgi:hypothetical protein
MQPMTHLIRRLVFIVTLLTFAVASSDIALARTSLPRTAGITSPDKFFGFQVGAERKMARLDKLVDYYNQLAKESPGLKSSTWARRRWAIRS